MKRWWFILLAVVLGWFTPARAFAHTRAGQAAYDAGASLEKVVSVAGITMDTYQGNTQDPLSLHKYLYCEANPVDNDDPLGLYTPDEGGAMERLIGADYSEAHPMADVTYGQWTRIGKNPQLKPDIFNKTDKTYADIKPLSLGGLYGGIEQLESYDNSLKNLNYTREQWLANSFAPCPCGKSAQLNFRFPLELAVNYENAYDNGLSNYPTPRAGQTFGGLASQPVGRPTHS